MPALQVVWFKRDLRVWDHRPLAAASRAGPVLPLYIVEPGLWAQPDASARQWRFVRASLTALDAELRKLGSRLILRRGEAVAVLAALHRERGIAALWSHQETGNDWTYRRDRAIAAWARQHGIPWHEFPQDGVIRRLATRDGWARRRDEALAEPLTAPPRHLPDPGLVSEPLPELPPGLTDPDPCPYAQPGGRAAGLDLLETFLTGRGLDYARDMSSPLTAWEACSRLSPHLAWGTLSLREVVHALRARQLQVREDPRLAAWRRPLAAFEARLAWRSHFMQKLESAPRLEFENLHPALAEARQTVDAALLAAWAEGRTGYPLVDACMRALAASGWLNFCMRAMLAAFACYHLWQPWRAAGLHLARLFTDYEPGIHWSQMQMPSGSTGINAWRIYNPVKQSLDQDPEGAFIRHWLPELKAVPAQWIHTPWRMTASLQSRCGCRLGHDYPLPIVDHEAAARSARVRLAAAYRGSAARAESQRIQQALGAASGGRWGRAARTGRRPCSTKPPWPTANPICLARPARSVAAPLPGAGAGRVSGRP